MIVALDDFEFFCKLENTETEEYHTTTVKRKQAIAFTNELFHAGGQTRQITMSTNCLLTSQVMKLIIRLGQCSLRLQLT